MTLSRGTKDKIRTALGRFQRGYIKGIIKSEVEPRIDDLERAGIGENEFRWMVENDFSFYDNVMPPSWKEGLIKFARKNKAQWDAIKNDRNFEYLFLEALGEVRSWLPGMIKGAYFESEFLKFKRDVDAK